MKKTGKIIIVIAIVAIAVVAVKIGPSVMDYFLNSSKTTKIGFEDIILFYIVCYERVMSTTQHQCVYPVFRYKMVKVILYRKVHDIIFDYTFFN